MQLGRDRIPRGGPGGFGEQARDVCERLGFGDQVGPGKPVAGVAEKVQGRTEVPRFIVVHAEDRQLPDPHPQGGRAGDEVVFGGGKVIRESMGQGSTTRAEGATAWTAGSMTPREVSTAPGQPEHIPARCSVR